MFTSSKKVYLIILFGIFSIPLQFYTTAQNKQLTFNQVYMFGEPRILKQVPRLQGWYDDEHYLMQKRDAATSAIVKVNVKTSEETIVLNFNAINPNLDEAELTAEENIGITKDYTGLLFYNDSDLFFYSIPKNKLTRLTNNKDEESNPMLSPDGKKVAFTRNRDLYLVDIESTKETRLTNDASEVVYNGYASWVYMEEIIGRSLNYRAFWWAPNSEMIAFLRFDDSPVPKFPLVNYSSIHGELEWQHYPKPGDPNPIVKMGIAHINTNNVIWVDEDETADQYTAWPFWSPDSKQMFYQVLNRNQNYIQILSANPETGKNRLVYEEKSKTWVEFFEDIYILKNNKGFILRSEADGWRHLYFYDMNGELKKQLTKGEWNVSDIKLVDEKNERVYFEANKGDRLQTHLFVVDFYGDDVEQLSTINGTHKVTLSPNGKYYYDSYSEINSPGKLDLYDGEGTLIKNLGDRKSKLFDEYKLGKTELFSIKTEDGFDLPGLWVLPPDFDENKKYPVLFSVYGGPGGTDVTNSFSAYLDRYFISQSGIIYFVVDHRGSAYFGKRGKDYLFHNLGKWETNDYSEAVNWLKTKSFVDTTKIGITGSSYGGYVTCLALTLGADYFTHGLAEYSVTDWQLYDNVYTERYMDLPSENKEGYKFGSAMTHANKYKGLLRITHGTLDDNCHMQNTLQLVDKFTSMDKHFELMLYPNERHGVGFPKWQDAQREYVQFWFKNFLGKDFINE
ncbi:MAG: DPP IV N-terminal domain-containing protein [Ignavibacteriales bacterium]|nr:DPP IV N-terminal domain-containing protein [Ignavibacteriales bacterium]